VYLAFQGFVTGSPPAWLWVGVPPTTTDDHSKWPICSRSQQFRHGDCRSHQNQCVRSSAACCHALPWFCLWLWPFGASWQGTMLWFSEVTLISRRGKAIQVQLLLVPEYPDTLHWRVLQPHHHNIPNELSHQHSQRYKCLWCHSWATDLLAAHQVQHNIWNVHSIRSSGQR